MKDHRPDCPYASREAAHGNGNLPCNCPEDVPAPDHAYGMPVDYSVIEDTSEEKLEHQFPLNFEEACCVYSCLYTGIVQIMEETDRREMPGAVRVKMLSHRSKLSDLVRDLREFLDEHSHEGFAAEMEQGLMEAQADGKLPVVLP